MRSSEANNIPTIPARYNAHLTGFAVDDMLWLGDRVCQTINEMFQDRGYDVLRITRAAKKQAHPSAADGFSEELSSQISQIEGGWGLGGGNAGSAEHTNRGAGEEESGEVRAFVYAKNTATGDAVVAVVLPCARVGISDANAFYVRLKSAGVKHGIIVAAEFSAHYASVKNLYIDTVVEVFTTSELVCNPTHHELVCRHEALNDEERQEFEKIFAVRGKFVPRIIPALSSNDIMTRYYNFKQGQIVRVHRSQLRSSSAPELDSFRIVRG